MKSKSILHGVLKAFYMVLYKNLKLQGFQAIFLAYVKFPFQQISESNTKLFHDGDPYHIETCPLVSIW